MKTVFLIEDNAADVDLFRMALDSACVECQLVVFGDGCEVIDYIRPANGAPPQNVPDLVVLDLNLPKNDGVEILQIMRKLPAFASVSIVVFSSYFSNGERATLSDLGIRGFITKPPDLEEYLSIGQTVSKLLDNPDFRPEEMTRNAAS